MATLKISDLSVGDWVKVKECAYFPLDKPNAFMSPYAKVTALEDENCIIWLNTQVGEFCASLKNVEPIPITAEILEKNGWSNDGMYATLRIDEHRHLEYYSHEHRLRKYYCGIDEWQNHAKVSDITFAVHCYSVHQLQHALRLAGVDKEINL